MAGPRSAKPRLAACTDGDTGTVILNGLGAPGSCVLGSRIEDEFRVAFAFETHEVYLRTTVEPAVACS